MLVWRRKGSLGKKLFKRCQHLLDEKKKENVETNPKTGQRAKSQEERVGQLKKRKCAFR